ncbi:uncharacterized protein [Arachis hypogaea]|uniref:uncharacterized protein n=1 Tax=Arachis hypogaea TaxID=3818 RepID=UPI0034E83535
MAVADNTRMKGMEADIKKLFQMFESITEENRSERARASEATNLKIDAIQDSLTQLLQTQHRHRSEIPELSHGSNSGVLLQHRSSLHSRRVNFDLPKFDGTDALGWIFSMDQYFDFFQVPEEEQIGIAAIHMTGAAIPWFQMSQRFAQFRSWNQVKRVIELEFGPSLFESPRELLFKLQQGGTVSEYYSEFVALANRTPIDPPEALRDCFVSGLTPEVRREVKAQCPPSLMRAVSLARLYEEKLTSSPKTTYGPAAHKPQFTTPNSSPSPRPPNRNTLPALLPTPSQRSPTPPLKNPVRRLTPAEIQSKREKGLCYWCDERFSANHRCTNRQFMWLQLELDENMAPVDDLAEPVFADNTLESLEGQVLDHHLSCNAMHGTPGPSTIRVKVSINGLEVQALIDGGSSDSFIQPRIAKFLNLPIEPAPGIKVIVGDFNILTVEGKIANLDINVAGCTISIPEVYVLHVAGGDLVIGTTWLMTLKVHIVDYNASFLRFVHQGKFVTFWGEKNSMASQIQFHHIQRLVSTHAIAEAFTLELQTPADTSQASLPLPASLDPALASLLRKYVAIFATPSRLPPQRSQDHSIPLVAGAEPVKARPYRYPHSLKSQIESMVQDMLQGG